MANHRWNELESISDMSKSQWDRFKEVLEEKLASHPEGLDGIIHELVSGETKPHKKPLKESLAKIRKLKSKKDQGPPINKRLRRILTYLALTDQPTSAFEDRVYLADEDGTINYVGKGGDERWGRYSGKKVVTFKIRDKMCVPCLESIATWICRAAWHSVKSTDKSPELCDRCRDTTFESFVKLLNTENFFGPRKTVHQICQTIGRIADQFDEQL